MGPMMLLRHKFSNQILVNLLDKGRPSKFNAMLEAALLSRRSGLFVYSVYDCLVVGDPYQGLRSSTVITTASGDTPGGSRI